MGRCRDKSHGRETEGVAVPAGLLRSFSDWLSSEGGSCCLRLVFVDLESETVGLANTCSSSFPEVEDDDEEEEERLTGSGEKNVVTL